MRVRQTRDTRGDMETANIRILPLASVNPRFLVSLMLSVHLTTFSSLTYPSLLPSETRPAGPGRSPSDGRWGVGDEWSERSVTERGKQEQTRRGPSFPSSLRSLRPRFVPSVSHHVISTHHRLSSRLGSLITIPIPSRNEA